MKLYRNVAERFGYIVASSNNSAANVGFQVAARAYGAYLERFPRTKSSYEMRFYYAECLYNSFHFPEAANSYQQVRDSSQDNKFLTDAAFNGRIFHEGDQVDERALLYLADRVVEEESVVTLAQRQARALKRYGQYENVRRNIEARFNTAQKIQAAVEKITGLPLDNILND